MISGTLTVSLEELQATDGKYFSVSCDLLITFNIAYNISVASMSEALLELPFGLVLLMGG
jgi:hypothetical protein